MNGQPIQVVRSWFHILTFKKNGTLASALSDPHYGPGPSWRWHSKNPFATRLWPIPALDFWLEEVNGHPRPPSGDPLSKRPRAARIASECRLPTPVEWPLSGNGRCRGHS
jgi:hypothetical protein